MSDYWANFTAILSTLQTCTGMGIAEQRGTKHTGLFLPPDLTLRCTAAAHPGEAHARAYAHHHARRQGWPLPVIVAVGELEVEQEGIVCRSVQAVCIHQHLEAQAAASVKARRVHHAYRKGWRHP